MSDDGWEVDDSGPTVVAPQYERPRHDNNNYRRNNNNYDKDRNDRRGDNRDGGYNRSGRSNYDSRKNEERQSSNNYGRSNAGGQSETFEIDSSKVGLVIGRGGAKIREIQELYNVNVKIDRDVGANGMSTVRISGVENDIGKAKSYIEDLVSGGGNQFEYKPNPPPVDTTEEPEFVQIDWQGISKRCEEENQKKWAACPTLIKNFYKEDPTIANMTLDEVAVYRELNNNITVSRAFLDKPLADVPIPNPIKEFEHCFKDYPDLLAEIKNQGFKQPSPIQAQAWPVLLKGEDMIGIAQTGTGKTLAFLLPAMIHTEYQPLPRGKARGGPNVLVMAPTRELAIQIEKEVGKYQFRGMKAVCVYGGGDRKAQIASIGRGVEIVIATPGRLNDLIQDNVIDVASITYLVLDEADRMLDMGFEPQIRKFLLNVRPDRQTVMTSATWPPGVRRLAEKYMINPVQVCIGTLDLAAVHTVQQIIEIISEEDKFMRIMEFVRDMSDTDKAIIFCGKKTRADDLSSELTLEHFKVQCIHGDRDQNDREQALADIKSGEVNVLIATDVASRGIDIEDITHVVNYDFPRNIEEYVHRVGRTGRAGRSGISLSFFTRSDWGSAAELIKILDEAEQEVPDELQEMQKRFKAMKERKDKEKSMFGGGGGRRGGGGGGGRFNQRY